MNNEKPGDIPAASNGAVFGSLEGRGRREENGWRYRIDEAEEGEVQIISTNCCSGRDQTLLASGFFPLLESSCRVSLVLLHFVNSERFHIRFHMTARRPGISQKIV